MRKIFAGLVVIIACFIAFDVSGVLDQVGGLDTFINAAKQAASGENLSFPEVTTSDGAGSKDEAAKDGGSRSVTGRDSKDFANSLQTLELLTVKGKAPKTGYGRDQFGPAWKDIDKNGCDTRNDMLKRDLDSVVFKQGSKCAVQTGVLAYEPYLGGVNVPFERGNNDKGLDAEHVVALGNAWVSGAWQWDITKATKFANDPAHLLMVDPGQNRAKGDKNAAEWLPKNKDFRCEYISIQVDVKHDYDLSVTQAEYDAMAKVLQGCN